MVRAEEIKIGDRKNMYSKTLFGRTLQGIMIQDDFADAEEFNNALDTNIWTDQDSDANFTSLPATASSRLEQDGSTTAGSARVTTVDKFSKNIVVKAKLLTTTFAVNAAGSIGAFIRLQQNSSRFVKWGSFEDGSGSPNSTGVIRFQDSGESSQQTINLSLGNVDAIERWYAIEVTEDHMRFYTREGDSGAWTLRRQLSVTGIDKFDVSLITETESASDSFTDIFWSSFSVVTLDYWKLEILEDKLDFASTGGGNWGIFSGMPVSEATRGVFWVDDGGAAGNDGLTDATAIDTIDAAIALTTANRDDVILVKPGAYDEATAAIGITVDKAGIHIFGVGQGLVTVENSNGSATIVMQIQSHDCEVAGLQFIEATNTVENIWMTGADDAFIHDNTFIANAQTGIGMQGTNRAIIQNNEISGVEQQGILVEGTTTGVRIVGNQIFDAQSAGIFLNGDGVDGNFVWDNIINGSGNTTTGISIALGDNNMVVGGFVGQCTNIMADTGSANVWHIDFDEITGSFNIVAGDSTNETNKITAQDLPASGKYAIQLDISSLDTANEGSNIDFFAFTKIDNTNLRKVGTTRFIEGTDSIMGPIEFHAKGGDSVFQLASQVSTAVTGDRAVPFKIVKVT